MEAWGIEATVKALEFTENILHHQALGMFDRKFGENTEMKVRKPHPSVDNSNHLLFINCHPGDYIRTQTVSIHSHQPLAINSGEHESE